MCELCHEGRLVGLTYRGGSGVQVGGAASAKWAFHVFRDLQASVQGPDGGRGRG